MYFHTFYGYTNYVCIENKVVNDKIAYTFIITALLFSLQDKLDFNFFKL